MQESAKLVGVGASAGGLDALIEFFKAVPGNSDWAFLVIQHLSPDHESMMHELLAPHTKLPVVAATNRTALEGGTIYLCPPGVIARVNQLRLELTARPEDKSVILTIDILFESMAETLGAACAGVVLSGTGSDGTKGVLSIERSGGIVAAQSPETADYTGMPQSAIATGKCHIIAPPGEIFGAIEDYAGNGKGATEPAKAVPQSTGEHTPLPFKSDDYAKIFRYLEGRFDLDFSLYRINSVSRRLNRRMDLLAVPDVSSYLDYLEKNDREAKDLYQDLLIGVTGFFRDPASFESLGREAIRSAMTAERTQDFRIWSAGCATGQEAYSLYMLADEVKREVGFPGRIMVFATDVFKPSIDFGSEGIYRREDVADLGDDRIERYFQEFDAGNFKIRPHVRENIVFARHNFLTDAPFTNMDIVSCRNVLIYLKSDIQEAALGAFLFSLRARGFLFLGSSESLGKWESSFKVISNRARIYQKHGGLGELKRWPDMLLPASKSRQVGAPAMGASVTINRDLLNAYDSLLGRFAPCGFLINGDREVLHYFGDAADFCIHVFGRVNPDLTEQLDKPLRLAVTTMVHKTQRKNERAVSRGIRCNARNGACLVDVVVEPLRDRHGEVRNFLVEIHRREMENTAALPTAEEGGAAGGKDAPPALEQVELLEAELKLAHEQLEAANEELHVSNNELQTLNEELQTMNEELQSTNEELYSLNEELTTLNAEYERKNHELVQVNASHENLLESIEDGVLDVDKEMRIRRFNTAIKSAFSLKSIDVGRPLHDIAYKMEDSDSLLDDVRSVLEAGKRIEGETTLKDGRRYMKRIAACLDEAGKVDGALLTYTDVTQIRRMEKRFMFALQTAKLSWWDWDLSADLLDVTSGGDCLLGEGCLNVPLGRSGWLELVHPDDREEVRRTLDDCLAGRTGEWSCEHRFRTDAEEWLWVRNQGIVTRRDDNGEPLEMMGTTQDVDASKRMLVEAQNQQAILAAAGEISKVGTWDYDLEKHELFCSDQTREILEVDEHFLPTPENFFKLVHAEDLERLQTVFERAITEGRPYDLQLRFRSPQGRELLCRSAARVRYDETGRVARIVGIFQDITELTRLQQELEAFFNLSPDFQATLAMDGSFKFCSPSWERELGYSKDEIFSMHVSDLVHEADRPAFRKTWDKVAAGATVTNYETRVITKPGAQPACGTDQPWISWSFSCEPKLAMVFVSARGVTAQKEAEKALQEARLRAEEASRAKSDFLAVMSHELRTPLNPILGFADMLIDEVQTEEHKDILNMIVESGDHMLSLINEILNYSKIDAGKTKLEPAEFSLTDFVEQKIHLMSGLIKEAPITLSSSIDWGPVDESRSPVLIGDIGMLRQVCRNLIANAIKFTKQGRVDFDVTLQSLEGERAVMRFDIKDSGIGIAQKDLSKLFTPFTQVQAGMTREYGGTGLGLAICKRLVELMDGTISVESKEGEGSTFSFTLPLVLRYRETSTKSADEPSRPRAGAAGGNLRGNVLLVEDNESNAYYIKKLVEVCGATVECVAAGESALQQLRERDFDLLLLDLHMPGIGGLETLRRIRSSANNRIKELPVFILTADVSAETERECQKNGSDGFLAKPIRPHDLQAILEHYLAGT